MGGFPRMQRLVGLAAVCLVAILAFSALFVSADLPIHCLNAQVAGDWEFSLDGGAHAIPPSGDLSGIACGYPQPDRNADHFTRPPVLVVAQSVRVTLAEPNIAIDQAGNKGTWTMIYDEGFEVRVGGRVFFAYNKYVPNKGTSLTSDKVAQYTSHCDETMVGWVRDEANTKWGCFRGRQTRAQNSWTTPITKVADDGADLAPVVSPTGLLEAFSKVLQRDTDVDSLEEQAMRAAPILLEEDAEVEADAGSDESDSSDLELAFSPVGSVPHPRSHVSTELPELADTVLFEPDHVFIERHNSNARSSWRAKSHPQFERKPVRDMLRMLGLRKFNKGPRTGPGSKLLHQPIRDTRPDSEKYAGLPTHWDWSDRNGVSFDTEIRNQGSCGSCYAMASISALEARFRVKSHLAFRPILSPQEVVSCSFYNQGCEGGYPFLVAKHASEFGMVEAECMPYTARNSECAFAEKKCQSQRLRMHNYSYVGGYMGGCSEAAMMHEIYANGPVMVAFQAPPDLFYYTGGIYTGPSPKEEAQGVNGVNVWQQTNHAVVAVGWGVDAKSGVKYWKLKNTWGKKWGEAGYFRIRRGTNECGVESMATKADVLLPEEVRIPADAPNPWAAEVERAPVRFKASRARRQRRRASKLV